MTNPRIPTEAFSPASFMLDEIEARGWTLDDLAERMGGHVAENLGCLAFLMTEDPRLRLGKVADQLGKAFGTSGEVWRNLEDSWLRWKAAESN